MRTRTVSALSLSGVLVAGAVSALLNSQILRRSTAEAASGPVPHRVTSFAPPATPAASPSSSAGSAAVVELSPPTAPPTCTGRPTTPAEIAQSQILSIGPTMELIPQRLWRNPNMPQWGRPVLVGIPPGFVLVPGEMVGIRRL